MKHPPGFVPERYVIHTTTKAGARRDDSQNFRRVINNDSEEERGVPPKSTGLAAPRAAAIADGMAKVEAEFVDKVPIPTPLREVDEADSERGSKKGVSAVLLATKHDQDGFPRLLSCLASISRFLGGAVTVVVMVVPDDQKKLFVDAFVTGNKNSSLMQELLTYGDFQDAFLSVARPYDVVIHGDSEILSAPRSTFENLTPHAEKSQGGRGTGYRIQMLLKLAVARLIQTDFYITLDQDVFASRTTSMEDLIRDGKAIYQGEGQGEGGLGRTQHHASWWRDSEKLLQCEGCHEGKPTIGVTPAILSRTIALAVAQEVESLYRGQFKSHLGREPKWDEILFHLLTKKGSHDWTEYTLYWAAGCKRRKLKKFHNLGPPLPGTIKNLRLYGYWGWSWGSRLAPAEFKNKHTVFGVLQSISGANGAEVAAQLRPFIVPTGSAGAASSAGVGPRR